MWESTLHVARIVIEIAMLITALGFGVASFRNINKDPKMAWVYLGIYIGILTGL